MRKALVLAVLLAGAAPQQVPDDVAFDKDVVYGKGAGEDLKLNLARPKESAGARPCILAIHGGGWAAGKKEDLNVLALELVKKGYVAATVGYRLAPKHLFPAQIEDVKCAVRHLRANAEKYGIDPKRIGAVGFSAGAHLSMILGTMGKEDGLEGEGGCADQPSQVNAVVAFFGPTDFVNQEFPPASRPIVEKWIGGTKKDKPEEHRKASPIVYVSKGDAPTLLIQGTKDPLVPHAQATAMVDAMTAAGVEGRCDLIVGAGHGWGGAELVRTRDATVAFFDQHLKKK